MGSTPAPRVAPGLGQFNRMLRSLWHGQELQEEIQKRINLLSSLSAPFRAWMGLGTELLHLPHLRVRLGSAAPKPTGPSDLFLYLTLPEARIEEPLPHLLLATGRKPLEPFLLLLPGRPRSQMLKPHVPSPSLAQHRWTQLKTPQNNAWPGHSSPARVSQPEQLGLRGQAKNRGVLQVSEDAKA